MTFHEFSPGALLGFFGLLAIPLIIYFFYQYLKEMRGINEKLERIIEKK